VLFDDKAVRNNGFNVRQLTLFNSSIKKNGNFVTPTHCNCTIYFDFVNIIGSTSFTCRIFPQGETLRLILLMVKGFYKMIVREK
jgi:hypothetical protein